jgi:hypothetical protein
VTLSHTVKTEEANRIFLHVCIDGDGYLTSEGSAQKERRSTQDFITNPLHVDYNDVSLNLNHLSYKPAYHHHPPRERA